jgi:aldose 1-epimerase
MTERRELTLRGEGLEVVILPEVGGRIHRLRAFDEDLLRTPGDVARHVAEPLSWGAYVMAPWCNRAAPGPMQLAGRRVNLAPNFPDGTAIHGLVSSASWVRRDGAELAIRCGAGDAWPWAFEVRQAARLEGATLEVEYRLVNLDPDAPMPAGLGLHPWFRRPVAVRLPADRAYASNTASPAAPAPVYDDLDLRTLSPPADWLDGTWTGLTEPRIELVWTESRIRAVIEVETDAAGVCVAVATPGDLDAVAVEPQTHGPDPLRRLETGEADPPALLPPGASLRLALRVSVERTGGPS